MISSFINELMCLFSIFLNHVTTASVFLNWFTFVFSLRILFILSICSLLRTPISLLAGVINLHMRKWSKLLIPADKTNNLYELTTDKYNKLLTENISKAYKKSILSTMHTINTEAKQYNRNQSFITLKDHKENFKNNPKCRLINPAKSEIAHPVVTAPCNKLKYYVILEFDLIKKILKRSVSIPLN